MDAPATIPPQTLEPQQRPLLDLHIRLPPQTVLRIDALIGERGFVGRSEAIRAIIEQFLASRPGVYNAEEQAWIRRHPSYAVDPQFQARIAAEYNAAQAEGFRAWERGAGSAHGSRRGRHGGCGGSRSGADVEWDDAGDGAVIV